MSGENSSALAPVAQSRQMKIGLGMALCGLAGFLLGAVLTAILTAMLIGADEKKIPARDPARPMPNARAIPKPDSE